MSVRFHTTKEERHLWPAEWASGALQLLVVPNAGDILRVRGTYWRVVIRMLDISTGEVILTVQHAPETKCLHEEVPTLKLV